MDRTHFKQYMRVKLIVALIFVIGIVGVVAYAQANKSGATKAVGKTGSSFSATTIGTSSNVYQYKLGQTITVTTASYTVDITLTRIIDPATGGSPADSLEGADDLNVTPVPGDRFVAALFSITNKGPEPYDAFSEMVNSPSLGGLVSATGSDNLAHFYDSLSSVAECTNMAAMSYQVDAGTTGNSGCVVFEIPIGVSIKTIKVITENNQTFDYSVQ